TLVPRLLLGLPLGRLLRSRSLAFFAFGARRKAKIEFLFQRVLVVTQCRVVARHRNAETGRQAAFQEARSFEFLKTRQIVDRLDAEIEQEIVGRAVGYRTARRLAAAAQAHPAGLDQEVERALGNRDATDLLDLGA